MVGCVGVDDMGDRLLDVLAAEGIDSDRGADASPARRAVSR